MFKGKIHRATVTSANLNYVGSITIDKTLLDASGILPGERVQIVNNHNGARLETYVIEEEAKILKPKIVFVDERNKIVEQVDKELHGEIK